MKERVQRQIAYNEALFRDVNEAIESGRWLGEEAAPTAFRCECGHLGCSAMIELSPREYERIREHPKWFAVAIDHQMPEVEHVVQTHPGYLVVEKLGEAGRVAEQRDPRT
jgi:hypothetical protein